MKGVVCHHYHQKSYSGIARKVLEAIGQRGRGVYGGCSLWNDPSDPIRLAVMIIEIFPIWLWPVQSSAVANSSTVRGQGKVAAEWVGEWRWRWWGEFAVLFSVLILFALSLLLPLTPVIYDVHPSSGRVHQLLVARRSWQQLCVARGVGFGCPAPEPPCFNTHTPFPQKTNKKKNP